MTDLVTGNAVTDTDNRSGWFVGHFVSPEDIRFTNAVEVKWGIHCAGERNAEGFVANKIATTMSLIIAGHFRLFFRTKNGNESVDLDQTGCYALWMPGVEHHWQAITDSTVLTVRWPSVPKDQCPRLG